MLMTEGEARRSMVCPIMTRAKMATAYNDVVECNGTQCPMWRWGEEERSFHFIRCPDQHAEKEPPRPEHVPESYKFEPYDPVEGEPASWVEPDKERQARRRGYCGLAGQPWGVFS